MEERVSRRTGLAEGPYAGGQVWQKGPMQVEAPAIEPEFGGHWLQLGAQPCDSGQ
jgi:hypothetical protein